jgi:hypothetical protein
MGQLRPEDEREGERHKGLDPPNLPEGRLKQPSCVLLLVHRIRLLKT